MIDRIVSWVLGTSDMLTFMEAATVLLVITGNLDAIEPAMWLLVGILYVWETTRFLDGRWVFDGVVRVES